MHCPSSRFPGNGLTVRLSSNDLRYTIISALNFGGLYISQGVFLYTVMGLIYKTYRFCSSHIFLIRGLSLPRNIPKIRF